MFFECWALSQLFLFCSFTLIKRLFSSSSLSAIRVLSSANLSLLIFFPAILRPACDSSSPAFHMMYSAYKLNKQGDSIQLCHIPFPILNQSAVPCPVLTAASWPTSRFLRRQVRWFDIPIFLGIFQFVVIHTKMEEKLPIRNQNTYMAIRCKKLRKTLATCFQIYYLLKQSLKFDLSIFLIYQILSLIKLIWPLNLHRGKENSTFYLKTKQSSHDWKVLPSPVDFKSLCSWSTARVSSLLFASESSAAL